MSTGVVKTLEIIATVQDLAVRLIAISNARTLIGFFTSAPSVFADIQTLASDVSLVVPELAGVDADDVGRLGSAAYGLVTAVVAAIKAA